MHKKKARRKLNFQARSEGGGKIATAQNLIDGLMTFSVSPRYDTVRPSAPREHTLD